MTAGKSFKLVFHFPVFIMGIRAWPYFSGKSMYHFICLRCFDNNGVNNYIKIYQFPIQLQLQDNLKSLDVCSVKNKTKQNRTLQILKGVIAHDSSVY